jgi:RNA methyltransferase, TrmH family
VLALKGTAALWSPKVLRAGMGAHFGLRLSRACSRPTWTRWPCPWWPPACTADALLPAAPLPSPCAWLLGHEGQGRGLPLRADCWRGGIAAR